MGINLRESIKRLTDILKNASKDDKVLINFINEVSKILNSDILLLDLDGNIICEINENLESFTLKNEVSGEKFLEIQILKQIQDINNTKINITLDNLYTTKFERNVLKNIYSIFLPINIYKEKIAVMLIYKKEEFLQDVDILCDYISSMLSILIWNYKSIETKEKEIKKQNIKACISTLSYSELEATIHIFDEIKDSEGLVVASKIADKAGITRSVIVNALRKFESARIIETRSLGMKGTHIKVLNEYLLQELNKFKG